MVGRTRALIDSIVRNARRMTTTEDYRQVVDAIGDASVVLLGESTHGTHEFYRARTEITKLLVREKGFRAVAVEADWPDALRVNRYVRGESPQRLESFVRFPSWMWRNAEVVELVDWLRSHNTGVPVRTDKVGFYGLDLYCTTSGVDFEDAYAHERKFVEPREGRPARRVMAAVDGVIAGEDLFLLEQHARVRRNATQYFEAMQRGLPSSWNVRDRHMAETLHALVEHLSAQSGEDTKIVVWAHNSHVGDARATQMGANGDLSLGQLARERWGKRVALVGMLTNRGTVIAASTWGGAAELKSVRHAHPESYEALFSATNLPSFMIDLRDHELDGLSEPRLQRAIGALYLPEAEMENHYFTSILTRQFDQLVYIDETRALTPLDAFCAERRCA
jgi:erythromycin esterase-like protein